MIRPALAAALALLAAAPAPAQAPAYEGYALPGLRLDRAPARPEAAVARPDTTAPPDAWIAYDKALHAGGSFLLTLSGQYVLVDKGGLSNGEALPVSASGTLLLGLLKEVADSRRARHPLFSWRDLVADGLGVLAAAAVTAL